MNAAHLHIVVNHIAVIGVPIGAALLILGLWTKSEDVRRASFFAFLVFALAIIPTYLSGDAAEDIVEPLPGVTHELIEAHEDAGWIGLVLTLILGVVSLAALFVPRRLSTSVSVLVLAVSLGVSGWLAWTANLGGKIRHTEVRGDSAAAGDSGHATTGGDAESGRGRGRGPGGR